MKKELSILFGDFISNLEMEEESSDYHACRFLFQNRKIVYRKAKVTPKKVGQFVTVWKRTHVGPIAPFDEGDSIDFVIIQVDFEQCTGVFVFPKSVLIERKIISSNSLEGKRGFRVYPDWDEPTSRQAIKSQQWQNKYFYKLVDKEGINKRIVEVLS